MGEVEDDVRTLLRSSEELKATLVVQPSLETAFGEAGLSPEVRQDEGMRILAVVSHRDEWDASLEEGRCVHNLRIRISKEYRPGIFIRG